MRASRLRTASSILAALLVWQSQDPQQPVFRGRLETVTVPVTVFDPTGELVTRLTRDDFTVLDNGRRQEITAFTNDPQPLRAVALVDMSASMAPAVELARMAAEQFVLRLQPGDRAQVGVFSQPIRMSPRFTSDRDELLAFLGEVPPFSNPTRLLDAIVEAMAQLRREDGRRVVLVFTDGCDTASRTTWSVIRDQAWADDVMIYVIHFRPDLAVKAPPQRTLSFGAAARARPRTQPPPSPCALHHYLELPATNKPSDFLRVDDARWTEGAALLTRLTTGTGGDRITLTPADDVGTLFSTLMRELRTMYLIGFTPQTLDGKVHDIEVKVPDRTLIVHWRRHYQAPPPPTTTGRPSPVGTGR